MRFLLSLCVLLLATSSHANDPLPWLQDEEAAAPSFILAYQKNHVTIADEGRETLNQVIDKLQEDDAFRATLKSYASNNNTRFSEGRRVALKRALEVRKEIVGSGINARRVIVKAVGPDPQLEEAERIDVYIE